MVYTEIKYQEGFLILDSFPNNILVFSEVI